MKYILIALFIILHPVCTSAQKKKSKATEETTTQTHHLYGDIAFQPGFSVTYNYRLAKHWGIGGGIQGYSIYPTGANARRFVPGVFADIHFNIRPEKNNQLFLLLDLGMNFYKENQKYYRDSTSIYYVPHNNGFYTGLGFAYFRRLTKRGGGPYMSFKPILNWYTFRSYSLISVENDRVLAAAGGALAVSIGFKF